MRDGGPLALPSNPKQIGLRAVLVDWGFFALSASVTAAQSLLGLGVIASELTDADFSEWAVLTACMTVLGAISQGGLKTGYMHTVVDAASVRRHHQALRAGAVFLFASGFIAGGALSLVLWLLSSMGYWQNLGVWWSVPIAMAFGNAQMLLITDLRIKRRLHWVTLMNVIALPLYAALLGLLKGMGSQGLPLVFAASALSSVTILGCYLLLVRPRLRAPCRWSFLPGALRLGFPVMLGLLIKYSTDAIIPLSIWGLADPTVAGDWGRVTRALEPFTSLYFIALMMAWGPNAVLIAGGRSQAETLRLKNTALVTLVLCVLGLPLAPLWVLGITPVIPEVSPQGSHGLLMMLAISSRAAAFAATGMAGYRNQIQRDFSSIPPLYLYELIVTATLVPAGFIFGYPAMSLLVIGIAAWIPPTILLMRPFSRKMAYTRAR